MSIAVQNMLAADHVTIVLPSEVGPANVTVANTTANLVSLGGPGGNATLPIAGHARVTSSTVTNFTLHHLRVLSATNIVVSDSRFKVGRVVDVVVTGTGASLVLRDVRFDVDPFAETDRLVPHRVNVTSGATVALHSLAVIAPVSGRWWHAGWRKGVWRAVAIQSCRVANGATLQLQRSAVVPYGPAPRRTYWTTLPTDLVVVDSHTRVHSATLRIAGNNVTAPRLNITRAYRVLAAFSGAASSLLVDVPGSARGSLFVAPSGAPSSITVVARQMRAADFLEVALPPDFGGESHVSVRDCDARLIHVRGGHAVNRTLATATAVLVTDSLVDNVTISRLRLVRDGFTLRGGHSNHVALRRVHIDAGSRARLVDTTIALSWSYEGGDRFVVDMCNATAQSSIVLENVTIVTPVSGPLVGEWLARSPFGVVGACSLVDRRR